MTTARDAARALLANRDAAKALSLAEWKAQGIDIPDETAGYAAQAEMERILTAESGHTAIGYKIGATNQAARDMLGVESPFFGRLYAQSSSESPGRLQMIPGVHKVLEPEVAIRIGEDLEPGKAPFDAEAIRQATAAIFPAFEAIISVFDPWTEAGGPTLIGDNGAHGFWYPGTPGPDSGAFDPLDSPITVTVAGSAPVVGRGSAVDGGAYGAAAWLANKLASMGRHLRAGDVISTGTVTPPIPLAPGQQVLAEYGPLGSVHLTVS